MDGNVDHAAELAQRGNEFRLARYAMRVSLDDASRVTHIRTVFLNGIECGDFTNYTSAVIASGHVKIYARFLRIEHALYVAELQSQEDETVIPTLSHTSLGISRRRPANLALYAFLSSLVVLSVYLYVQFESFVTTADAPPAPAASARAFVATPLPSPKAVAAELSLNPTATLSAVQVPVVPTSTPIPPRPPTPTLVPSPTKITGLTIDAVTTDRAWVQVEADNRVVFSGTLNPGERRSWVATQRLMLWTGNAAGVSVTYNGKSLGRLGAVGEVVKLTWTATS